jgi:toxin ParE1/3/4
VAARSVHLRELAVADIDAAVTHDIGEAGPKVAEQFVDALERTVTRIGRSPQTGSLRFSYELGIPDLRVRPVVRFPYLVFYVFDDDAVAVWRVLHTRRDIPSAVADEPYGEEL